MDLSSINKKFYDRDHDGFEKGFVTQQILSSLNQNVVNMEDYDIYDEKSLNFPDYVPMKTVLNGLSIKLKRKILKFRLYSTFSR